MTSKLLPISAVLFVAALPAASLAQTVEGLVVTARDPAGLLERAPSDTVFGLEKPLLETPRSASLVSDLTLERYGVRSVEDLIDVSPGAFTASYYGVPGSMNLRGTLAETYFRGFKRIENRGTYPTPLGAADRVEIVRGPPSPYYGPGKVGGQLNFVPKTARVEQGWLTRPTGEIQAGLGAYSQKRLSGRLGLPVAIPNGEGGLHLYLEAEDADRFYRGIHPSHHLGQASADFEFGRGWSLAFGGMAYRARGYVQTPGWNRLTQALIDDGTYTTGRDATLVDLDGNGRLTPDEIGPGGLVQGYFGFPPGPDPRFTLDTGLGTARLDRRTVFVSDRDFSDTDTRTAYLDLGKALGGGRSVKLQLFHDTLQNRRFVSYGFPAEYDAAVSEARASFHLDRDFSTAGRFQNLIGASMRRYSGEARESYNGGFISLDRRDLTVGPTPTDIFDDPFSTEPGGMGLTWETDIRSRWTDVGLFALTDLALGPFGLTAGLRYDTFSVHGRDEGTVVFGAVPGQRYRDRAGDWSYSLSLSWRTAGGFMPYATWARTATPELNQAGGISPQLIAADTWLADSELKEAGVKFRLAEDALTGSLAAYSQTRTQLTLNNTVQGVKGEGLELEVRYLASPRLSFTFAGNLQRTTVRGPDASFVIVPPAAVGVTPEQGYGGAYALFALSGLVPGDYRNTLVPASVASLYAVYTGPPQPWGRWGATLGASYVGSTRGVIPDAVRLPSYAVANGSAYVENGPWRLALNVDNLFDRLYFTPVADVYANVAALPARGRVWRASLRRAF